MAKLSLNRKITIRVLIPFTILIVMTGIISTLPVYLTYPAELDTYADKMIEDQREALREVSFYLAKSASSNDLQYASNFVLLMGATVNTMFRKDEPSVKRRFSGKYNYVNGEMFDREEAFDYPYDPETYVNYTMSTWWLTDYLKPQQLNYEGKERLKFSAIADAFMRPVAQLNNRSEPVFLQVYIGYDDGMFYETPARYGNYINPKSGVYFNPINRPWWILTKENPPKLEWVIRAVLTTPYSFASTMQLDQTACSGFWYDRTMKLAICADFSLNFFKDNLLNVTLTSSTTSFMLSTNETAGYPVIIHPNIPSNATVPQTIQQLEFPAGNRKEINEFNEKVLPLFSNPNGGETSYYKDGVKMMISVSPIIINTVFNLEDLEELGGIHWASIGLIIPEQKLIEDIQNLKSSSKSMLIAEFVIMMFILFCILIVCYYLTTKMTASILEPIFKLVDLLNRLTQGDYEIDIKSHGQSGPPEIQELYEEFDRLRVIFKFEERNNFKDPTYSLLTYAQALVVFSEFRNKKAMKICQQEIGKLHFSAGRFGEASENLLKAVALAEDNMNETPADKAKLKTLTAISLMKSHEKSDIALQLLDEAMSYYEKQPLRDIELAVCLLNYAELLMNYSEDPSEQLSQARHVLSNAIESDRTEIAFQKLLYLEGLHSEKQGNLLVACKLLTDGLYSYSVFNFKVRSRLITALTRVLQKLGEDTSSLSVLEDNMENRPRDIVFVIEQNLRPKNFESVIRSNIQNYCNPCDRVSYISFDHRPITIFGLTAASGIQYRIDEVKEPSAKQWTALYDALDLALNQISSNNFESNARSLWIVLVSDGFDNASNTSWRDIAQKVNTVNAHLVVLGCDEASFEYSHLREIAGNSERGCVLPNYSFETIRTSIESAMRFIYPSEVKDYYF